MLIVTKANVDLRKTAYPTMLQAPQMLAAAGHVWRNVYENNIYRPTVLPERWEALGMI